MNQDEIRQLYEKYSSWVFNRAKGILKDDEQAWEIVQDVFVKILEVGSEFRGESTPWTWLYRITTNHCLNKIRSRKAWDKAIGGFTREEMTLTENPSKQDFSVLIDRNTIVKLLEREDEMTQKIIYAYFFDDLTQEEITETLDISRKTVYKRLQKFFEKARKRI